MAGILNNKERIMDLLVTKEGRRQAASGQLRVQYATFTDHHTFYHASGSDGVAEDATNRIFFEASSRYQDVIVPELEPGTTSTSRPFRTEDFRVSGKSVASGTFRLGVSSIGPVVLTGSELAEGTGRMLQGVTKNFTDQRIIGTEDPFSSTTGFKISQPVTGTFSLHNYTKYNEAPAGQPGDKGSETINIDTSLSMFQDVKLSHLPNFKFLPPINRSTDGGLTSETLGVYPQLDDHYIMNYSDLQKHLEGKEFHEIEFEETSRDNNVIAQMFEFSETDIEKLSIIDFGVFPDNDPFSPDKHVYFIGKVRRDTTGTDTFINLFTVVFD